MQEDWKMEIEVMFDDIRVKEKVRCKKYFIDLDLKIAQKVFVKLQCNSCTKKNSTSLGVTLSGRRAS